LLPYTPLFRSHIGDNAQTGIGGRGDLHDAGSVGGVTDPEGRRRPVGLTVPDRRPPSGRLNGLDLEAGAVRCPAVREVARRGGVAVEIGPRGGTELGCQGLHVENRVGVYRTRHPYGCPELVRASRCRPGNTYSVKLPQPPTPDLHGLVSHVAGVIVPIDPQRYATADVRRESHPKGDDIAPRD